MADVYKIGVSLTANTSSVTRALEQLVRGFRDLDKLVKDVQRSLDKLAGGGGADLTKSFSGAVREATQLDKLTKDIARNQATITKEVAAGSRARGITAGEAAAARTAGRHDNTMGLMALGMGGAAETRFAYHAFEAAAEVDRLHAQIGMTEDVGERQIEDLKKLEQQIVRSVPGSTIKQIAHIAQDIFTATGDWEDTLKTLPTYSKLAYVLENGPGKNRGDQAFAAAQSTELMQRAIDPKTKTIDAEQFNRDAEAMMRVRLGTGGRVSPTDYAAMAKQARSMGITANDDFLFRDLPAMMVALPGNRAGTALNALSRQFVVGRGTKAGFAESARLGLIRDDFSWKGGRLTNPQRDVIGYDLLQQNPAKWAEDYVIPAMRKHGIDVNDKRQVATSVAKISSTPPVQTALDEFILGLPAIHKEGEKIRRVTTDPMKQLQEHDPTQRVREFSASWNELITVLGEATMKPATAMIKEMTSGLRAVADWAREHPGTAKVLMEVATGLGVLATALSTVGFALQGAKAALSLVGVGVGGGAAAAGTATGAAGAAAGAVPGGAIAKGLLAAGAAAGAMDAPMVDDFGNKVGSWSGGPGTWGKSVASGPVSEKKAGEQIQKVLVVNGKDIANGTIDHMANQASRPPSGKTGVDPRVSPVYSGMMLGP